MLLRRRQVTQSSLMAVVTPRNAVLPIEHATVCITKCFTIAKLNIAINNADGVCMHVFNWYTV
jgi:hypothetical protein